jgi:hypothetical protein
LSEEDFINCFPANGTGAVTLKQIADQLTDKLQVTGNRQLLTQYIKLFCVATKNKEFQLRPQYASRAVT